MFSKFRKKATKVTPPAESMYEENAPEEVSEEIVELEPLEEDDDYISDEEWEKMTPEQRKEYEDDDGEDGDDDDYISDEEWEKMTPEQRKEWEDGEGDGDEQDEQDDPDYLISSPEVVGFDSIEQQQEIYEFACEEIEEDESLLDFGCGRGDLYEFLYKQNGQAPKYRGIDINEPLITTGLEKYAPDIDLEKQDWFSKDLTSNSDWCVNIGSLCTRYDTSSADDMTLIAKTIDKMMSLCTAGCVLVLFSSYMPKEVREESFVISDPKRVFDYVMKKYGQDTGNVILDHSYSDSIYKITILK